MNGIDNTAVCLGVKRYLVCRLASDCIMMSKVTKSAMGLSGAEISCWYVRK